MAIRSIIKTNEYHDSVSLMLVAGELSGSPGVQDAAVVMATEANQALLDQAGLLTPEIAAATPNDLVIVVRADEAALEALLAQAERLLKAGAKQDGGGAAEYRPKSLHSAVRGSPQANVAVISVAGRYATDEAWKALHKGLHVLLFSDNVSLEDEIALKKYASEHGLLLMGPGAGTAILNGVALGFANVVPQGPVGIVSAAGTGLQEVSTLLARKGVGITQGIGTGGRDLKEAVGGMMMLAGLKALQEDPQTQVIALVSKPPSPAVARLILEQVAVGNKPTVIGFMGGRMEDLRSTPNALPAPTLEMTALIAAGVAGVDMGDPIEYLASRTQTLKERSVALREGLQPGQKYLRGLFSGGTLCYEAQVIWSGMLAQPVLSNAPLDKANQMPDSTRSQGHCTVDLGEEEFTVGRPHPMIDNTLRIRRLQQEAQDAEVAVIILDVVLGYGAHLNPAAELGPAIQRAQKSAAEAGRSLPVIVSVCGTEQDPQVLSRQVQALEAAGALVCESNAMAAELAAWVVS